MTRIAHAVPSESSGDGAWAACRRPTLTDQSAGEVVEVPSDPCDVAVR
jgi:hypothetical protein